MIGYNIPASVDPHAGGLTGDLLRYVATQQLVTPVKKIKITKYLLKTSEVFDFILWLWP